MIWVKQKIFHSRFSLSISLGLCFKSPGLFAGRRNVSVVPPSALWSGSQVRVIKCFNIGEFPFHPAVLKRDGGRRERKSVLEKCFRKVSRYVDPGGVLDLPLEFNLMKWACPASHLLITCWVHLSGVMLRRLSFGGTETNQTQTESERITSEKIKDPSGQSLPEKTVAWAEYACPSGLCALSWLRFRLVCHGSCPDLAPH